MRKARLIQDDGGIYHCVSRFVDRSFCLESREAKEFFHTTMRNLEGFLGVRVLTYCLMSNHFHILVQIPDRKAVPPLTEDDLRRKLPRLYSGMQLRQMLEEKGHTFYTNTDTEVLVHLYESYGTDMFEMLNGQFAMALWDEQKKKLVGFRAIRHLPRK